MISKYTLCMALIAFDCGRAGAGSQCTGFIAKSYKSPLFPLITPFVKGKPLRFLQMQSWLSFYERAERREG
jgi:hypothetical protein